MSAGYTLTLRWSSGVLSDKGIYLLPLFIDPSQSGLAFLLSFGLFGCNGISQLLRLEDVMWRTNITCLKDDWGMERYRLIISITFLFVSLLVLQYSHI